MMFVLSYYLFLIALFNLPSLIRSSYADVQFSNTKPDPKVEDEHYVNDEKHAEENLQKVEKKGKDLGLVVENSKLNFRRKAQLTLCNVACTSNPNCQNSADSCKWCVQGRCQVPPTCGTSCSINNDCYAAPNGCNSCIQNRCQVAPICGTSCSNNNDCYSATPCNYCVNWVCAQQAVCGSSCTSDYQCSYGSTSNQCTKCIGYHCNRPQCGSSCSNNNDCYYAPAGCNVCSNYVCTSNQAKCNLSCQSDAQCSGATDGCIYCNGVFCVQNRVPNPQSCVSDANGLYNAAMGSSSQITLCPNSKITLTSTITISRNGMAFTLYCSGSCSIVGNNNFQLMVISASTVTITGITFQGGNAISGNGGAITLTANSATFQSCTFNSNTAGLKGGAVFSNGPAKFTNCMGSNNQAAQCDDVYLNSNGSCCVLGMSC